MSIAPASQQAALLEEARATHRAVGKTFWLASRMLPRDIRDDVNLLYLVLRSLDDAVDELKAGVETTLGGVERWAREGALDTREALILADLSTRYAIDPRVVLDFCAGMRSDLAGTRIETEQELDTYCYRVAGTVGVLMTALLGADDPVAAQPSAIALGMAMQRTNILRDIDEDLAAGRVYLASETINRFGSILPGHRAALLRDQIQRADVLYDQGIAGIGHLNSGRRAIAAAAGMYRQILRQIEREGLGARAGRAVVPLPRKVGAAVAVQRDLRELRRNAIRPVTSA